MQRFFQTFLGSKFHRRGLSKGRMFPTRIVPRWNQYPRAISSLAGKFPLVNHPLPAGRSECPLHGECPQQCPAPPTCTPVYTRVHLCPHTDAPGSSPASRRLRRRTTIRRLSCPITRQMTTGRKRDEFPRMFFFLVFVCFFSVLLFLLRIDMRVISIMAIYFCVSWLLFFLRNVVVYFMF